MTGTKNASFWKNGVVSPPSLTPACDDILSTGPKVLLPLHLVWAPSARRHRLNHLCNNSGMDHQLYNKGHS